jgi:hypothetical protein
MTDGTRSMVVRSGVTFGSALAMTLSFDTYHSVFWAAFDGLLSWLYVLYFVI